MPETLNTRPPSETPKPLEINEEKVPLEEALDRVLILLERGQVVMTREEREKIIQRSIVLWERHGRRLLPAITLGAFLAGTVMGEASQPGAGRTAADIMIGSGVMGSVTTAFPRETGKVLGTLEAKGRETWRKIRGRFET